MTMVTGKCDRGPILFLIVAVKRDRKVDKPRKGEHSAELATKTENPNANYGYTAHAVRSVRGKQECAATRKPERHKGEPPGSPL